MKTLLLALWALIGGMASAYAQASLEITLLDSSRQAVVGQPMTIRNAEIGFERQAATNASGKVQLDGLSTSGRYTVEVPEGQFYGGKTLDNIALISDQTQTVTLVLAEKTQSLEGVTVTSGDYQSVNAVNAEVASELSAREIEALPVEGRDITRTLYRLPNITQATGFFPEAPNVAINGANPLYTNYQIDGLDNNENFLGGQRFAMPVGFTQNITALTNNFSAEHGLTSNGVINITTKSGTNQVHGEAFYVTRPGPVIDAPSAYALRDLSGNEVKDGFQRHQAGFAVGGPIVKDKTFYFVNVEHTTDWKDNLLNVPQLGINQTIRGNNHFTYASGKLDHHWNDQWRSSLRLNVGQVRIDQQGGGLEGGVTFPSAGYEQTRNSTNIALKNTYLGKSLTYEANYLYGRFAWNYADPFNPGNPTVTVLDPQEVTAAVTGSPGFVFDEEENSHIIQQKLTLYREQHRIKVGGQLRSSGFELFGGGNPNGNYTVKLNEAQLGQLRNQNVGAGLEPEDIPEDVEVINYNVELQPNAFAKRQNIVSLYLEDQWSLSSRLNLNLGVRWDYDNLSRGGGAEGDYDNIGPRVSANYKLDDLSTLRAGYGIYYDKILYAIYSDALQQGNDAADFRRQLEVLIDRGILPADTDLDAVTNDGNVAATLEQADYLRAPEAEQLQAQRNEVFQNEKRILNPSGYQNPYSHQFMLGYQRKLREDLLIYVDLMHNRSHNLFRLRRLNAPAPYPIDPGNVVVRSQAEADLSRPVAIQSDADEENFAVVEGDTLRGIARNITMTETEGRSNYYAMNITLQKDRGAGDVAYRLMYTLSFLENNTEDINFRAMDANDFEAEWGPSINDRRHLINGIVTYFPHERLRLTLAALLQSGQPINRIPDAGEYGTTDLNGDGQSFGDAYVGNSDRAPGESRNSDRLPWSNTFDLSAYYTLPITSDNRMEIGAQVFNVFNAENLSGFSNNATQSNQIQVGPAASALLVRRNAAPPRQFQFSARYLF